MPFMRGPMPLRRTFFHLDQGKIFLRQEVSILSIGFNRREVPWDPMPSHNGAREFVFWHWAQLQYKNPHLQMLRDSDWKYTPFAQAILKDGREVLFDLEHKTKDEIANMLQGTLGKTQLVRRREFLEQMQLHNPAEFGEHCKRHCICEVQGQAPCTNISIAPTYMKGKWRGNHKRYLTYPEPDVKMYGEFESFITPELKPEA